MYKTNRYFLISRKYFNNKHFPKYGTYFGFNTHSTCCMGLHASASFQSHDRHIPKSQPPMLQLANEHTKVCFIRQKNQIHTVLLPLFLAT